MKSNNKNLHLKNLSFPLLLYSGIGLIFAPLVYYIVLGLRAGDCPRYVKYVGGCDQSYTMTTWHLATLITILWCVVWLAIFGYGIYRHYIEKNRPHKTAIQFINISLHLSFIGWLALLVALTAYPLFEIVASSICTRTVYGGCELGFAMSSWLGVTILVITCAIISLIAFGGVIYIKFFSKKRASNKRQ